MSDWHTRPLQELASTPMPPELHAHLMRDDSPAAQRFIGMGFKLRDLRIEYSGLVNQVRITGRFICICGRQEKFANFVSPELPAYVLPSAYEMLDNLGATSRKHLLDDGYTEAEIDDMERRLERYRGRHNAEPVRP